MSVIAIASDAPVFAIAVAPSTLSVGPELAEATGEVDSFAPPIPGVFVGAAAAFDAVAVGLEVVAVGAAVALAVRELVEGFVVGVTDTDGVTSCVGVGEFPPVLHDAPSQAGGVAVGPELVEGVGLSDTFSVGVTSVVGVVTSVGVTSVVGVSDTDGVTSCVGVVVGTSHGPWDRLNCPLHPL